MKTILAIGGHDPSGGAGIQADIETIAANGGHAVTAVTALTVQDTVDVARLEPVHVDLFRQVLERLEADISLDAIKIGLIGNASIAVAIAAFLARHPGIPVVLDPVLVAGGGKELSSGEIRDIMLERILPHVALVTPNLPEAQRLTGEIDAAACAAQLIGRGAGNVLVTGGHDGGDSVVNRWFDAGGEQQFEWERLDGAFHGSGCTLASAIAVFLARGMPLKLALRLAQAFTHDALARADQVGRGQKIPHRVTGA
ncbi:MAG: hydroxymethylpyrimidine/phosphomethylpyrimidine kinase [Gammaproteobacteria bacterium]